MWQAPSTSFQIFIWLSSQSLWSWASTCRWERKSKLVLSSRWAFCKQPSMDVLFLQENWCIAFLHRGCICGIVNVYYRVLLKKEQDTTYNTATVQLGSIIDNTIGIIVGCLPVIQPAIISCCAKACRLFSIRSLISRISSKSRASIAAATGFEKSPEEDASSKRIGRPYLETEILHGADGEGKFMSSIETNKDPLRSWLPGSRDLLKTQASRRINGNHTTAIGTQLSGQNVMTTASISSRREYIPSREMTV